MGKCNRDKPRAKQTNTAFLVYIHLKNKVGGLKQSKMLVQDQAGLNCPCLKHMSEFIGFLFSEHGCSGQQTKAKGI